MAVAGSSCVALGEIVKDEADSFSTQELIQDAESECIEEVGNEQTSSAVSPVIGNGLGCVIEESESGVEGVERVSDRGNSLSGVVSSVDPQLSSILQNLNNSGNLTIHFHFDRSNK